MHTTKIMQQLILRLIWIPILIGLSNATNTILNEWLFSYVYLGDVSYSSGNKTIIKRIQNMKTRRMKL